MKDLAIIREQLVKDIKECINFNPEGEDDDGYQAVWNDSEQAVLERYLKMVDELISSQLNLKRHIPSGMVEIETGLEYRICSETEAKPLLADGSWRLVK